REKLYLERLEHSIDRTNQYISLSQFLSSPKDGASLRQEIVNKMDVANFLIIKTMIFIDRQIIK
ncbi:MAG: hypothetical protein ACP5MU_04925, partial [Thermoplasmata archaeon]